MVIFSCGAVVVKCRHEDSDSGPVGDIEAAEISVRMLSCDTVAFSIGDLDVSSVDEDLRKMSSARGRVSDNGGDDFEDFCLETGVSSILDEDTLAVSGISEFETAVSSTAVGSELVLSCDNLAVGGVGCVSAIGEGDVGDKEYGSSLIDGDTLVILSCRGNFVVGGCVSAIIGGRAVDTNCASSLIDADTLVILSCRGKFVVGETPCVSAIGDRDVDTYCASSLDGDTLVIFSRRGNFVGGETPCMPCVSAIGIRDGNTGCRCSIIDGDTLVIPSRRGNFVVGDTPCVSAIKDRVVDI